MARIMAVIKMQEAALRVLQIAQNKLVLRKLPEEVVVVVPEVVEVPEEEAVA